MQMNRQQIPDYTIGFSKAPQGLTMQRAGNTTQFMDPAVAAHDSKVTDWLKYF